MATTAEQVFDIPELLELILLQVDDVRTTLQAQAVNTFFRDLIRNSPKLRRRLWLDSTPQLPGSQHPKYILNRLIDTPRFRRRLGIERLLMWKKEDGTQIIDVYFSSIPALGNLADRGSHEDMIVAQPKEGVEVVWCLGYYERPQPGRPVDTEYRLRHFGWKWCDGAMPTLGDIRRVVMGKYGLLQVKGAEKGPLAKAPVGTDSK